MVRNPVDIVRPKALLNVYGVKVKKALQPVISKQPVQDAEVEQRVIRLRLDRILRNRRTRANH